MKRTKKTDQKPVKKLGLKQQKVRKLSEAQLSEAQGGVSCRISFSQDACSKID